MRYLFLLITVFVFNAGWAQKMFTDQTTICPLKFILEDKEQYIYYEPSDSLLVVDFLSGIDSKQIEKLKGVIMMQVMIDTAFNICCVSFTNETNIADKKLDIPNRLRAMPGWKRIAPDLPNENICALIYLFFDKYDFKVQHIGYNRNKGKQLIESNVYKWRLEYQEADSVVNINN